ncbi:hypothetical protein [Aeoliella mucimassa]|nr:hypothetical protein [Aeoliella mucimassa]
MAQVVVLNDTFESGQFASQWATTEGTGTEVVSSLADGAGPSDYYARVQGVTGDGSEAGLGLSLFNLDRQATAASDFTIAMDFRIDPLQTNRRMFNLMVNGSSNSPTPTDSALNLRYWNDTWQAYNGSWQSLDLPAITADVWHNLVLTGSNWGSGVAGAASWGVQLDGSQVLSDLKVFQNSADASGARSLSLNDRWDGVGFDIDNVSVIATPGAVANNTTVITPTSPVAYSGIYPHTAVTSTHNEVAVAALVNRNDKLWFMTYGPHITAGGTDELYSVDLSTLEHTTYHDYPGNTDANRYHSSSLGIDIVGAAYIDSSDTIRYLPATNLAAGDLVGRITGTAAHLYDPNKLYYMTMEEGLYEVDFTDLTQPAITTLRVDGNFDSIGNSIQKNLPGVHGKGLYTGQGRLFFTNNGGDSTSKGGLVEWDGQGDAEQLAAWTIVDDSAQYTEVTSRRGPVDMQADSTDTIWATGWDDESMFINTRDASTGEWTKFRMPKSSYTHGHPNGWYTEWPRIRDVGLEAGYLMSHHGMLFLVPEEFSATNPSGVKPIASHHKMIVDFVEDGDQIVLAANDASIQLGNNILPRANSNILFLDKSEIEQYGGPPKGFGGVWVNDAVAADETSDAFLISGFRDRVVHFQHHSDEAVTFTVEVDTNGTGAWQPLEQVTVEGNGDQRGSYGYYLMPKNLDAQWMRVKSDRALDSATAYLHVANPARQLNPTLTAGLSDPMVPEPRSQGVLRSMAGSDFKLEFAADQLDASGQIVGTGYYQAQLNPTTAALELVAVDSADEASLRSEAATTQDFEVDEASVILTDQGQRFRLPKGLDIFDSETSSGWRRGMREVVTERNLLNAHGTIYEVPKEFAGGGVRRMVPITTHNLDIFDFMSWRGMLVLSGVSAESAAEGHCVQSNDGKVALWFGNVDDLWSFGAPAGVGGPWKDTAVEANAASDPYLMAGYDQKQLELSHDAATAVEFTIEVDFLGTDEWSVYDTLTVQPGESLVHSFADGYSAHWVRISSNTSTNATAWFTYSVSIPLAGDYNGDGIVNLADYTVWRDKLGMRVSHGSSADGDRSGVIDAGDYQIWRDHFGDTNPSGQTSSNSTPTPEPTSVALASVSVVLPAMIRWKNRHRVAAE